MSEQDLTGRNIVFNLARKYGVEPDMLSASIIEELKPHAKIVDEVFKRFDSENVREDFRGKKFTDELALRVWEQVPTMPDGIVMENLASFSAKSISGLESWRDFLYHQSRQQIKALNDISMTFINLNVPVVELKNHVIDPNEKWLNGRRKYRMLGPVRYRFFQIGFQGKDPKDLN